MLAEIKRLSSEVLSLVRDQHKPPRGGILPDLDQAIWASRRDEQVRRHRQEQHHNFTVNGRPVIDDL